MMTALRLASLRVRLAAEGVTTAAALITAMNAIATRPDDESAIRQKAVIAEAAQIASDVLRSGEMDDATLGGALGLDADAAILFLALHQVWSLADATGIEWASIWGVLSAQVKLSEGTNDANL